MTKYENIELDMTNDEIARIALAAHQMDVTMNEFFTIALIQEVRDLELEAAHHVKVMADELPEDDPMKGYLETVVRVVQEGSIIERVEDEEAGD